MMRRVRHTAEQPEPQKGKDTEPREILTLADRLQVFVQQSDNYRSLQLGPAGKPGIKKDIAFFEATGEMSLCLLSKQSLST